ncbi:MAG: response regulator, partial [Rhizobiaceae bacterium]
MKILCLDDDDLTRSITVDLLCDLGHDVLEADKGADAMRWIRRCGYQIDLIILDIRMPSGPDGRQVTKFARQFHPD